MTVLYPSGALCAVCRHLSFDNSISFITVCYAYITNKDPAGRKGIYGYDRGCYDDILDIYTGQHSPSPFGLGSKQQMACVSTSFPRYTHNIIYSIDDDITIVCNVFTTSKYNQLYTNDCFFIIHTPKVYK